MKTLKQVLGESHKNKSKKELIDLISGIKEVVGDDFSKITGLQISELSKIKNDDLLALIDDFSENYDEKWEKSFSNAPANILKLIFEQEEKDLAFFAASSAANADFPDELGRIPFDKLISGVLDACVTAQTNASVASVDFIQKVGFYQAGDKLSDGSAAPVGDVRKVNFKYEEIDGYIVDANGDLVLDGNGDPTPNIKKKNIDVPFIALVNVPSLRIENADIDINVKLNSVYSRNVNSSFGINASASGGFGPVKFKVVASYRRSSSTGTKVEKTYTMGVKVRATNDELPAGLEKVLNLLSA